MPLRPPPLCAMSTATVALIIFALLSLAGIVWILIALATAPEGPDDM